MRDTAIGEKSLDFNSRSDQIELCCQRLVTTATFLCCPRAKQRRWAPPLAASFCVYLEYNEGFIIQHFTSRKNGGRERTNQDFIDYRRMRYCSTVLLKLNKTLIVISFFFVFKAMCYFFRYVAYQYAEQSKRLLGNEKMGLILD